MKFFLFLLLLLSTNLQAGTLQTYGIGQFNPNFPIFGSGPLFNFNQGQDALTNASAHVAWAIAIPLLGEKIAGDKGKRIAGWTWIGLSVLQEALFHAPQNPGPGYASEVRTDMVTKVVPTLLILSW